MNVAELKKYGDCSASTIQEPCVIIGSYFRVPTIRENLENLKKSGNFKISQKSGKSQGISKLFKSWRQYSKIKIFENIQKSGIFQNYPEKQCNCI